MLVEKRVQINAIKTDAYRAGKIGDTVVITQGCFAVYILEGECKLDISKLKDIPGDALEGLNPDKMEGKLKTVKLTNKAFALRRGTARLLVNREANKKIWINKKYLKMFKGCVFRLVDTGEKWDVLACIRAGRIVGIILPVDLYEEEVGEHEQ